jgi:hypothetical protein
MMMLKAEDKFGKDFEKQGFLRSSQEASIICMGTRTAKNEGGGDSHSSIRFLL